MKHWIKIGMGSVVLGLVAYAANAENVTISTFYPSPYGDYNALTTVTLNVTGGTAPALTATSLSVTGATTLSALNLTGTASRMNASSTSASLSLATQNTDRLTVLTGGNVGIGTTTPQQRLDVAGRIRLQDASNNAGVLAVSCNSNVCSSSSALYS